MNLSERKLPGSAGQCSGNPKAGNFPAHLPDQYRSLDAGDAGGQRFWLHYQRRPRDAQPRHA
jgi:hypothetical protein